MTGAYTGDTVKPLTNPHIIDLFFKMQEHTISKISKLTNRIRNLNANFKRLESDVEVCKKVKDAIVKQVDSLERQCWRTAHYPQRKCAKIRGIPDSIVHKDLPKKVCKVVQHIGTESCHRFNKNGVHTKVKFLGRKTENR